MPCFQLSQDIAKRTSAVNWAIAVYISPEFFVGYALVPFILARVGFGLLNTVGHSEIAASNKPWLNFILAGEGYHRVHHTDSRKIRLHKYDTGGWLAEKLFEQNRKNPA